MPKNNTDPASQRNTLLSNGYTPLPLLSNGKGLYLKGWSTQDVDTEWLDSFKRRADYQNTGIRCDQLAAFDIDVLDPELADDAEKNIEDVCGRTELCRFGRAPKRLLLYRLKGKPPFKSVRTPKYEGDNRVELLCGNGRQFAAFGMHPSGSAYEWDGPSPLDIPFAKLPAITYKQATETIELLESYFDAQGLAIESPGLAFAHAGRQEWDLADDFECLVDGAVIEWGELKEQLDTEGVFGNIRRENGEFGDSDAVHFMLAQGSGQPCLHDFVRDCTHWEPTVPKDLADALPPQPDTHQFTPDPLADWLDKWALIGDGTVRNIDDPLHTYKFTDLKALTAHQTMDVGITKPKIIPIIDAWKQHPSAYRAHKAELRPDNPDDILVPEGNRTIFNTYAPPVHPDSGGSTDVVREFIEHLIPRADERQLFIDWHALKLAHPGWRMHGLVMVTPSYGTGRGTWIQILAKLFGMNYVNEIKLRDLIGTGGQSEFNEFMSSSLIVAVPEALQEREEDTRWKSRHLAYEQLKLVCDPAAGRIHVKRKYGKNSVEWCFASVLISSNHVDALAIEPGDRRLLVLENTDVPLTEAPNDLHGRIYDWLESPENIGALRRELLLQATAAQYKPFAQPIMTPAKQRMIEAGQSDTDRAFEIFAESAPGAICSFYQWKVWVQQNRTAMDLELPPVERLDQALQAVIQRKGRRIETLGASGNLKMQKQVFRPWVLRDFKRWTGSSDTAQIRAEIEKNGPITAAVVTLKPQK